MLAIPAIALMGYLIQCLGPVGLRPLGVFLFNFALIQLFLILCIVPHELGHAFAARALGWRVHQITIGVGKQVWKTRWRAILIDVRMLPLAGATFLVPKETSSFRTKLFLSILAGPLVNAAMTCALILGFGGSVFPLDIGVIPEMAQLFVFANVLILVINLWPFQPKSGMGLPTDGKRLLQLISPRKHALDEVRAMRFVYEAQFCRDAGDFAAARAWCDKGLSLYPDDTHLLNWSGVAHLDGQNFEAARAVFLRLLEKEKESSPLRWMFLNNIAYADALSGQPELLQEADAYSKDAYTMCPWLAAFVGTRGTVLVALGKTDEGIELLKKSLEDADSARSKSENACLLAIAHAKLKREQEAQKYLELAKQLDANCSLLERADRTLRGGQAESRLAAAGCQGGPATAPF